MRKILTLLIGCSLMVSCLLRESEEPKICKCRLQEYEKIVVFKNEHDGSYTNYSDTGWLAKGDPQEDSTTDCFRNETEKNHDFSSNYDSEYRREVYRKWIYKCR